MVGGKPEKLFWSRILSAMIVFFVNRDATVIDKKMDW